MAGPASSADRRRWPAAARPSALPWLAWVLFVVYGSLVPLDYRPLPLADAVERFRQVPFLQLGVASRADWVANGVLYLPVGALLAHWLLGALPRAIRGLALPLALLAGAALAVAVEFTQLYFPPRTVSQNDLLAEGLGTLLGALAAPLLQPWAARWRAGWQQGGRLLAQHAVPALALAVLALSFFPYDLLLTLDEWQAKLGSDLCGGWLAASSLARGWLAVPLLAVEALLALPFGLLLARGHRRMPWVAAALAGLLLGLVIEGGQLALASGVSQGASVLSRLLGVLLGAWLGIRGRRGLVRLRRAARRFEWPLRLGHAVLVLAASGLFAHAWRSPDQVAQQWAELRLLPFYYHYYTTEAAAMFSLGSVALLYAPVAVLGWAARRAPTLDLWLAGGLALGAEAAKLWLHGRHPDPTNVLVAVAVCALLRRTLRRAGRRQAAPVAPAAPWAATAPAAGAAAPRPVAAVVAALALLAALAQALVFPVAAVPLAALLVFGAGLVWHRPAWILVLLPAALPVVDLAPWSGRLLWNEWDLLCLAWLPLAWWRCPRPERPAWRPTLPGLVAVLWAAGYAVALARGGWPWSWPDANAWFSQHQPYNALRIGRGALWAAALLLLARRLPDPAPVRLRLLGRGLVLGLACTAAVVVWERAAFPGLVDFSSDYRVTGPFSAMHTGGATIESYLAVATVVAMAGLLAAHRLPQRLLLAGLVALGSYALMVTYSRNGWLALLAGALVVGVVGAARRGARMRQRLAGLALLGLVALVAWPVLQGDFARQRVAQSARDLDVRLAHWRDALALRDDDLRTSLLGQGVGRFPDLHVWRSGEARRAGVFGLQQDADGVRLRLGAGAPVYIEQIVDVRAGQTLLLTLRQRATGGANTAVALCEKWLLTSAQCATVQAQPARAGAAGWQTLSWRLDTQAWQTAPAGLARPVKLAVFHGGGSGTIDLTDLRLTGADGRALLVNGDFARGLDRWFYATDLDPPWHIHSLPVSVLFEQGWLGLTAWGLAWALALWACGRGAARGDLQATALLAALVALAVSASVNTLIDEPRVLWGVCVLLGMAALWRPGSTRGVPHE